MDLPPYVNNRGMHFILASNVQIFQVGALVASSGNVAIGSI